MGGMFETLKNAWRLPDLRKKLLFTIWMIILFRVGGNIPVPGVDRTAFTALINQFGQLGSMLDIMSGGALASASIFALGISPYINSSIIMQLLTVASPSLERLANEGETGRKKIQQITRILTVGLSLMMSFAFWWSTRQTGTTTLPMALNGLIMIASFTAGSSVVMWIGEMINEKGVGNGISIIIFAGIISSVPRMISTTFALARQWAVTNILLGLLGIVMVFAIILAGIVVVLFVHQAERRIPIQYSKRVVGRKMYGGQSTYLPIKVNQSGVLPVIFATSLMQLPSLLVTFFFSQSTNPIAVWFRDLGKSPFYYAVMFVLVIAFTFFYSMIQFNPIEISNNIQKNGGFIPGIRPGRPTSDFISRTSQRLCWFDGFFLAMITLAPMLIGTLTGTANTGIWFGGTSIIIIVGVCLDLVNQLESQMTMRHHKGFLD